MQNIGYNKMQVCTRTDEGNESVRPGVGIQILIDGTVYVEGDDYYVDVDSYFQALSQEEALIEFVGGCHYPACCANGAWTTKSPEAWMWNPSDPESNFRLRWADVHQETVLMLQIIDEHIGRNEEVWCAKLERIPFYRTQVRLLETRVHKANET